MLLLELIQQIRNPVNRLGINSRDTEKSETNLTPKLVPELCKIACEDNRQVHDKPIHVFVKSRGKDITIIKMKPLALEYINDDYVYDISDITAEVRLNNEIHNE
jgi:hypothetical protein